MKRKNNLKLYLIISFAFAWLIQGCAIVAFASEDNALYQASMMVMMYVPLVAVFFCERNFSGMGWRPNLIGKVGTFFAAWLVPSIVALVGGALFFAIFRDAFDTTGKYLIATVGEEVYGQMLEQGMTPKAYALVSIISALTYAPFLNMFLAVGEEVGWRGYMYPILKEKFGTNKGRIIGGFIWGVWHWPVMTIGYEYGIEYFGYPFVGPVVFCVYAIAVGIFLDWLYEKSEIIWIPSLAHGAVNAATFGLVFINPDFSKYLILGPVPIGIISMIPILIIAGIITYRSRA